MHVLGTCRPDDESEIDIAIESIVTMRELYNHFYEGVKVSGTEITLSNGEMETVKENRNEIKNKIIKELSNFSSSLASYLMRTP